MDKMTKEQRHRCMSAIKSKGTRPEILVRKYLFARGFRYRLNHPRLRRNPHSGRACTRRITSPLDVSFIPPCVGSYLV